ncbi:MAG: hypothetical protein HXS54_05940 [Theionarchaea archaeon]|nr:hypothetical protein [Theionarchaea archaeon]
MDIDKKILPLVRILNKMGIETTHSCEGDQDRSGYVTIQLSKHVCFHYNEKENTLDIRFSKDGKVGPSQILPDRWAFTLDETLKILKKEWLRILQISGGGRND